MEPTAAFHQRQEAAYLAEDGDLPAAEQALTRVVEGLAPSLAGSPVQGFRLNQLCGALVDRASVRRYANRWEDALGDLARAEELLASAPLAIRSSHLPGIHQLRAKLHLNPAASVFDLARAENSLARLRALGALGWAADDLEVDLASNRGDWARAVEVAIRVREALAAEGWISGVAFVRKKLGRAYLELGRLGDAARELAVAYTHVKVHGPTDVKGDVAMLLGRVRLAQGATDEAWTFALEGLQAHESITGRFRALDDQQRFLSDKLAVYRTAFDIALAATGAPGVLRAWSVAERAKSFSLRQMVRNADVPLFEGVDPALLAQLRALEDRLDALDRRAHEQPATDGGAARLALHAERQAALAAIMRGNPRWGALNELAPFDVEAHLARLRARGWVPVSYFFREAPDAGAQMHLFACDHAGAPLHVVEPWSAEDLAKLHAARARLAGQVSLTQPLMRPRLAAKLLPEAFRAALPAQASLLVSPHGGAHLLPLHALGDEGTRLGEAHDVQYIPTLALLAHAPARMAARPLLALGCVTNGFGDNPLQDVEPEIGDIDRTWSQQASRDAPTHARLLARDDDLDAAGAPLAGWGEFQHVHLACHGDFPEGRPFDAALRLGREAVRGSELFGARLAAHLVSLSACSVGRHGGGAPGRDAPEEWLGLYLPLFYAGARAVLVSLWAADSQPARALMTALHQRLARGEAPARALRGALDTLREQPEPQWANWYLVGVPSST